MGTIKQYFKTEIEQSHKKLLLAAVVLFGLICSLINPVKGIEQLLLCFDNRDKSITVEQVEVENEPIGRDYLTADSLASLNSQSDSSDESGENLSGEEISLVVLQESALLTQNCPTTIISQDPRSGLITYVVQKGDTPSSIAASFGITTYTLLWANNLKETSIIQPGDELTVLPVSGVLHRVKDGQTVSWIAKYYQADKEDIIGFNALSADGSSIQVGQKLIIPDGQMPAPVKPKTTYIAQSYTGIGTGKSHRFAYGHCTWYVAQKRVIPWSGHANAWLANAEAMGYSTCRGSNCQPKAGAIVSLKDSGWLARKYGHVAYVIRTENSRFLVSEMNRIGWGKVSVRWIPIGSYLIKGFIY